MFAGDLIGGVVGNLSSIVDLDDEREFPPPLFSPSLSPHGPMRRCPSPGGEGVGGLLDLSDVSWRDEDHRSEEEELRKV